MTQPGTQRRLVSRIGCGLLILAASVSLPSLARGEDLLELSSGAKVRGKVTSQTETEVAVDVSIGGRTYTRKYPLNKIIAVTIDGKRRELGAATNSASTEGKPAGKSTPSGAPAPLGGRRSRAEVDALIARVGSTPPDWFESTTLNYPQTLDLSWPAQAPQPWNNQKNVGQFIWDVINPNPNRWREGVRLMHHLMTTNNDNQELQTRAMDVLGRMYHNLLEDYARAAFWWRAAGVDKSQNFPGSTVHLAECYFRLGNKQMAEELLTKGRQVAPMAKLWADMGETQKALTLAEAVVRGGNPAVGHMYAGDACRVAGQSARALEFYQKVLAVEATGQAKGRIEREQNRARANIEAIKLFELSNVKRVSDGKHTGSSLGYEGQVQVEVAVAGGRIESVRVTQHREKQFYSALSDTPRKIIEKQGVKGVDATSSATITSEAIINATAKALAGGSK